MFLDVVVEIELVRVRPEIDGRDVLGPLHRDPGVQHVRREDIALEEELVIRLERRDRLGQRPRNRLIDALRSSCSS
jgi:hypothetical protein